MKHIARSTLIVAIFFGLEKVLGFARHFLVARQFGLSAELDAYNAANNLPDLLFMLISGGALAMAFIPVLTETRQKAGQEAAWRVFSYVLNLLFLVTASLSLLIALFAPQLVRSQVGIGPGFSLEQQNVVVNLMRLNLIGTLLLSLGGLAVAGLQANQHFWLPAIALSLYDLGGLVGVVFLAPDQAYHLLGLQLPSMGWGVYGLVSGTILGAFLYLLIQIPGLIRYRFRWHGGFGLREAMVLKSLSLMAPRVLTMLFIQLTFIAQDNLASRLSSGSITALAYGWLFFQVPETLIGTALGTVLLPTLAEQAALQDRQAFQQTLEKSLRVILAVTIPLIALLIVVIRPAVTIFNFGSEGENLVVWTARVYLLGLLGHSLLEVAVRAFYAQQDARTPLTSAALTSLAFILLGILFYRPLGAAGIALANVVAFSGQAFFLWGLLCRQQQFSWVMSKTLGRASLAALLCIAIPSFIFRWNAVTLPNAIVAGAVGMLVLVFLALPELKILLRL
ncbi:MAG: murein biosynthesis integral membrane protein MurJ [Anaerolineae bacterium]|nr:MAG: murein biosynthesis integral membrane protein MurJ [Anaerolineae bacterium]